MTAARTPRCVIAGGGPAGMMAGYLFARAGVETVVLEKHGDFLRDFRGDTLPPPRRWKSSAVQDAVAAANLLAKMLAAGTLSADDLDLVQRRRAFPAAAIQFVQSQAQNRIIRPILDGLAKPAVHPPLPLRIVSQVPFLRMMAARMIGMGVRFEHFGILPRALIDFGQRGTRGNPASCSKERRLHFLRTEAVMSYKTILAVLQGKADAGRVLDCALPLATRFSAHVIGVHSEAIPMPYVTPMGFPDTDFIATSAEINEQRSAEIKQVFETRASREGISFEWQALQSISGDAAVGALVAARTCDLIVAQQSDPEGDSGALANVETLLFESGRPVLFVPYAVPVRDGFRKVVIAWNGTQQAARAAFDALPFILQADETEILSIDSPDSDPRDAAVAGVDLAAALSRHGAKVVVASQDSGGIGTGEAIENRIAETSADLLVMGAYSQSWLKEFFFGGATRTVLKSMPVATLMSR